jgi:hypothetical protein
MGTTSFPGVKRPGRGADHPPSRAEVKEGVEIPLLHLWAFMTGYGVNFTFMTVPSVGNYLPIDRK